MNPVIRAFAISIGAHVVVAALILALIYTVSTFAG
jgi:hypothetical protein